jgi:RND superfamily putative drug exporter
MFQSLARFTYRYRWYVIIAWILLLVASIPILPHVPGELAAGGFSSPHTEAAQARATLEQNILGYNPSTMIVMFQDTQLTATDPAFVAQANAAVADVVKLPDVIGILSFTQNPKQISADGHTAYTVLQLGLPPEQSQHVMAEVKSHLHPTESVRILLTGAPAFYSDLDKVSQNDLRRAELIAIPFALIALLFVFGSVVATGIPLIVGALSVAGVLGAIFLVAHVVNLSIFVLNLTTMLGLGLAIDYSLFMTSRFREELDRQSIAGAVETTVRTAGRAVFFSGLTVLIGLAGLAFFDFMFLRSVGIAGALVVLFAVIGALTLLPAVLGIIGHNINRFSVYRRRRETGRFWLWVSHLVMHRPWTVLTLVVLFIGLLGIPFAHVNLSSSDASVLPESTESRQGWDMLTSKFGNGTTSPFVIAIESQDSITAPEHIASLYHFTRELAADPHVWQISSIVTLDPRISLAQYQDLYALAAANPGQSSESTLSQMAGPHATAIYVYTQLLPESAGAKDLLHTIRSIQPGPGLTMKVDGGTAEIVDAVDVLYGDFPLAIAIIIAATYLALLVQFRSILLPLKAVIINTLSIVASYGALVFVFQDGHFSGLLGFTPLGFVEAALPVLMFCLLFGVSMDYEVFLLSRMREVWDQTGDNREAVALGLARSGRIITGAALIVVVVTASFVSAEVVIIKALGLGIAIAVAIDATIIRALLVPATMRLLGHLNWWAPKFVLRALPKHQFEH